MIRPYQGIYPKIAASAYVDQAAHVIGDVTMGERASIWPSAVARGDVNRIEIGADSNIQDGSVLHGELDLYPVLIGDRVTVGHMVCLHGCVVEDDCLIGIGAIVLNGARIGRGSVVAGRIREAQEMDKCLLPYAIPDGRLAGQGTEQAGPGQATKGDYLS